MTLLTFFRQIIPFFRNFYFNCKSGFLNLSCLGISLGCTLMILMTIFYECSFDHFHLKHENIYCLINGNSRLTPFIMGQKALETIPEISSVSRIYHAQKIKLRNGEQWLPENNFFFAEASILGQFTFDFVTKESKEKLLSPGTILLSKSMAVKYFGLIDPVDKSVNVDINGTNYAFTVSGIYNDFPKNSTLNPGFLAALDFHAILSSKQSKNNFEKAEWYESHWNKNCFYTFFLLNNHVDPNTVCKKLEQIRAIQRQSMKSNLFDELIDRGLPNHIAQNIINNQQKEKEIAEITNNPLQLEKLTDSYFNRSGYIDNSYYAQGDYKKVQVYIGITILISLIAFLNFVIFHMSRSAQRMKEIAVRKINGSSQNQIGQIFILESVILSLLSLMPALLFIKLAHLYLHNHLGMDFLPDIFQHSSFLLSSFMITLVIGLVAGFLSFLPFSKIQPALLIKNNLSIGIKKQSYIAGWLVFQFICFFGLASSALIMYKQIGFSLGINEKNRSQTTVVIPVKDIKTDNKYASFRDELLKIPVIKSVAGASKLFPSQEINTMMVKDDKTGQPQLEEYYLCLSDELFKMLNLQMAEGKGFAQTDENGVLVNESFARKHKDLLKKGIDWGLPFLGVVQDFHFQSTHNAIQPLVIVREKPENYNYWFISVDGDRYSQAIDHIQKLWGQYFPLKQLSFYDHENWIKSVIYRNDVQQIQMVSFFAIVSIILTMLGLIGMINQFLNLITKEIGIRKVNGAKVTEILILLNKKIIKWVVVAFVIATPIVLSVMHKWLENFAYKTNLSWWIFALAGAIAMAIALLTVSWQSWKAATRNPVEALRYE